MLETEDNQIVILAMTSGQTALVSTQDAQLMETIKWNFLGLALLVDCVSHYINTAALHLRSIRKSWSK